MINPDISIITVVFNKAGDLEETIQSVLSISYKRINYIIIDGGSTDGTVEVITKHNQDLFYWISEPDKGVYDAMNKGWQKALADSYILFLGAGDKILSLPVLNETSPDIIYGKVKKGDHLIFNSTADIRLRLGNTIHHQALLIKKKIHADPPFNLNYPVYADFDFNQRLLKAGNNFAKDDRFLSFASEGGLSTTFRKSEALQIIQHNYGNMWVALARVYYSFQKIYYRLQHSFHLD